MHGVQCRAPRSNLVCLSFTPSVADGTASVCDADSGAVLVRYTGHAGSVNSVTFHPSEPLVCTTSGDTSAHIWQSNVSLSSQQHAGGITAADRVVSSEFRVQPAVTIMHWGHDSSCHL